ncbi:hypothetical protein AKJ29_14185 [Aliiroseovarius crassostreae]|uniref:Uncharacterized protein n=1 Tax=Aliiroseovarius crassostreae TaxID=154981 RepID=A0A0P7JQU9_9RHOB|nr:hypothetical protein AKJ29_14185 [Aliiroseovarius crassostreae]
MPPAKRVVVRCQSVLLRYAESCAHRVFLNILFLTLDFFCNAAQDAGTAITRIWVGLSWGGRLPLTRM